MDWIINYQVQVSLIEDLENPQTTTGGNRTKKKLEGKAHFQYSAHIFLMIFCAPIRKKLCGDSVKLCGDSVKLVLSWKNLVCEIL